MDISYFRISIDVIALAASAFILFNSSWRQPRMRYPSLVLFGLSLFIYAVSSIFISLNVFPNKTFWLGLLVLGATLLPVSIVLISLEYTQNRYWLSTRMSVLFVILATIYFLLLGFAYSGFSGQQASYFEDRGSFIVNLYSNSLLFVGFFIALRKFRSEITYQSKLYAIILVSIAFPLLASVVNLSGVSNHLDADLMMVAYLLTAMVILIGFNQKQVNVYPIERKLAIESMNDGWMILDAYDYVIDVNASVEKTLRSPRKEIINQPVKKVLKNWEELVYNIDSEEFFFNGSIKDKKEQRNYSIRLTELRSNSGDVIGKLLLWRDVTEQKRATEAKQRARDELFILLQSIMNASSHVFDLDEFLNEAIYQIVYAFRSQYCVIHLNDDRETNQENPGLNVAAHYGLLEGLDETITPFVEKINMYELFNEKSDPVLISNIEQSKYFKGIDPLESPICLVVAPMIIKKRLIGAIALAREAENIYSKDEITRVIVVADEMASFIQSDRRRQINIASQERKHIVRDLHDSISQNLYGLLALTEVAQAAVESGSPLKSLQYLPKIGESARQAMREMRLFLYQLQPVKLEQEGLVAVLHHRLSAVEGRANIKARFIADEDISLASHQELALYYIAQEALNNVLKHARPKSVTIYLRVDNRRVTLEIVDDGIGFNLGLIDSGGLGLGNMQERAIQAGGTCKIVSEPGQGTRIIVEIEDDRRYLRTYERY
ncbi:MAG: histidine kinase N-terminal 7TM domain-containing protein [Anaerolineae bacterium]|nr:histidine kinase N-terminal 7TM domain-containing protein [Anaerolineae bacterium]MDK1080230.1 histidine kinase N-terminal 7TM domain-containing protein [Anaerolineae bacterium]MDK1117303.1 histidine kinase N-terminal 7TM domain-containing protein [Anaerolineae bacterium]